VYITPSFVAVLLFLGVTSCAPTAVPPIGKEESFQLATDERRLWNMSKDEQKKLERSGLIYEDPILVAYLNEIAQRLIPNNIKEKGPSFKIKVLKNPLVNAFSFPNGVIYVHTGFVAKMENEAQLATLLAHEISHVTHRHAIQGFRNVKDTAAFLATLQVVAAPAGVYGAGVTILGAIGAMAAVSGYSNASEEEADREGLDLLVKAGYDPEEAPKLFDHVKRDIEEREITEPFFFGTHPRLQERKDSYTQLLQSIYADKKGHKGTERFMQKIPSLLLDNALLDLSMGRFSLAKGTIKRFLQRKPQSARGRYCLGEIFRQRGEEGDRQKAEREYQLAIQHNPSYPESYKGLGLIYYKRGEKEKARAQFERYLSLVPEARDKGYIEHYLQDIEQRRGSSL
ncbi:MAG: M48 family metalloprotease, partial [Candidatus Hydrothermarchaeales archaeon]